MFYFTLLSVEIGLQVYTSVKSRSRRIVMFLRKNGMKLKCFRTITTIARNKIFWLERDRHWRLSIRRQAFAVRMSQLLYSTYF